MDDETSGWVPGERVWKLLCPTHIFIKGHVKHINKRLTLKPRASPFQSILFLGLVISQCSASDRLRVIYCTKRLCNTLPPRPSPPPLPPHHPSLPASLLDFSSTHSSLEAGLFLLEGIASWLNHNQAMTLQPAPGSLIMENKQTTETLEVLLQGLKLYLASFFLKQVHTCTARSIFSLFFFFIIFLPSAQISHILWLTGLSPDLKYTDRLKRNKCDGGRVCYEEYIPFRLQKL